MSNFDFLKDEFIDLYELCLEAEKNCYIKPRTSAFYSRLALEFCVGLVYKFEKIQTSYNEMSLNDLINKKEFKDLFFSWNTGSDNERKEAEIALLLYIYEIRKDS